MKDSFSSASVASTYIDDEHVDTITNGAVMFQSVKRCKPSKQTPVKGNSQRREQSKYPLQSRLYAERCILSAHAQQRIALLMLLESCYAYHWSVELELLQCYYFYLSPFFEYARGTTVPLHNEKANEEGALNLLDVVFYLIENDPQYANWKHIHANDNHKEGANYYNVVCENKKNFTLLKV
ncbi:hypothetical protein ADEAN_000136100 [Angomonas deanei]|uniref:Uncharacterized protein n=1 Tax=Angomonas deanei TaxID=59799 RepID=A0A7G2C579_9TRYP|nr:hypothetical protein ADEAN_000136100 [Angomonas deanei]